MDFQLGVVKSIPLADLDETNKTVINSGQRTPSFAVHFSRQFNNPSFYWTTGLDLSFKNVRLQRNIDTLSYRGSVYTQPKYRTLSIPLLIGFQKVIDLNSNPIAEKKRVLRVSTGISLDFVKESRLKDGMSIRGSGFSVRTSYKSAFSFQANTGVSFNVAFSFPMIQFKNGKNIYISGAYKYPFYQQKNINIGYTINGDNINYQISQLRLQEISLGLGFRNSR